MCVFRFSQDVIETASRKEARLRQRGDHDAPLRPLSLDRRSLQSLVRLDVRSTSAEYV